MFLESFYVVIKSHSSPPRLAFFKNIRVQNFDKNKFTNLGQLNSNYIVQNSDFFGGKIKIWWGIWKYITCGNGIVKIT